MERQSLRPDFNRHSTHGLRQEPRQETHAIAEHPYSHRCQILQMKFGKAEACFLPVMAVTFFFLALPIPEKPLSLPVVNKPPECIGPSNATAVGFVLKFFIPATV